MDKKVYAIGMKGWVELRLAAKPPSPDTSEAVVTYTRKQLDYAEYYASGVPTYKEILKKLKMKDVTFRGGKVVGMVTNRVFSNLTKVSIRKDGILELPDSMVQILKGKGLIK